MNDKTDGTELSNFPGERRRELHPQLVPVRPVEADDAVVGVELLAVAAVEDVGLVGRAQRVRARVAQHLLDVAPVEEVHEGEVPQHLFPHHGAVLAVHDLVGLVVLALERGRRRRSGRSLGCNFTAEESQGRTGVKGVA